MTAAGNVGMALVTPEQFACFKYGTDKPTKAQSNTVREMCRSGAIKHASKVGRTWVINAAKELPECFAD